jgi:hypothetical protein
MIIEALKGYNDPLNHSYFYPKQFVTKAEKATETFIKSNMDYFANIAFAQYKQILSFVKTIVCITVNLTFKIMLISLSIRK